MFNCLFSLNAKDKELIPLWEFYANLNLPDKLRSEQEIRYSLVEENEMSVFFGYSSIYKSNLSSGTYSLLNNKSNIQALSPINNMYVDKLEGNNFIVRSINENDSLYQLPFVTYGRTFRFSPDGNYLIVLDFLNSYEKDITILETKSFKKEFYVKIKDNSKMSPRNISFSKDNKSLMIHSNDRVQPEPFSIPNTRIFINISTMEMKRDSLYDFNIYKYLGDDRIIISLKSKQKEFFIYDLTKKEIVKYLNGNFDSILHSSLHTIFGREKYFQLYTISNKDKIHELAAIDYETGNTETYRIQNRFNFEEVYEKNDTILLKSKSFWKYYKKQVINNIELNDDNNYVQLYPNPIVGLSTLNIKSEVYGNLDIIIVDINGKVVKQFNLIKSSPLLSLQIEANDLTQGSYKVIIQKNDNYLSSCNFKVQR
jgi:hypothetical protein